MNIRHKLIAENQHLVSDHTILSQLDEQKILVEGRSDHFLRLLQPHVKVFSEVKRLNEREIAVNFIVETKESVQQAAKLIHATKRTALFPVSVASRES